MTIPGNRDALTARRRAVSGTAHGLAGRDAVLGRQWPAGDGQLILGGRQSPSGLCEVNSEEIPLDGFEDGGLVSSTHTEEGS